ncbi:hypothetical protein [Actinoplanes derwentensis]|nr:hypothetical protein [Actinoplanes derwentensis]
MDSPRVATSRVEAPLPVRLDALSLLAAGSEQVTSPMHPLIRRWSVTTTIHVQTVVRGETITEQRRIPQWFSEPVYDADGKPVLVPDDDQIGSIPPREWLDMTVRAWRAQLGHRVPARTSKAITARLGGKHPPVTIWPAPRRPRSRPLTRREQVQAALHLLHTPAGQHTFCLLRTIQASLHRPQQPPPPVEPIDPLAADIQHRFGTPATSQSVTWDVKYLLTWLDTACDRDLGIAEFAAELGAVTAELARALGEEPAQTRIGRCPAFLLEEHPTGHDEPPAVSRRPCGAELRHEPGWAQVPCPRCHSVWEVRGPAAIRTAREIRRVWPIDRHRRYTADEIDGLPYPRCPTCSVQVTVRWREVTDPRDKTRTWQPASARCENGCEAAGRTL